ncbi:AAA family ATPase [Nocardia cyriacigeorgica]|nr:AAA family ATPase [Nocardia cyriacigeorgica]
MFCHNADKGEVLASLGLTMADLYDQARTSYDYPDGRTVLRSYRNGKKDFRQRGNTSGRALFGADQLPGDLTVPVYVVEGEQDVIAARAVGAYAVTQAQGAQTGPERADWSPLADRPVIVVRDADEPGHARAEKVGAHLAAVAASVEIAEAKAGKDLADHIAAGFSVDDLVPVRVVDGPPWSCPKHTHPEQRCPECWHAVAERAEWLEARKAELGSGRRLVVTRGSEVKTKRVRWVELDWIPVGALVLLAGREGLGKSTIAAEKCARVTRGELEGEWFGQPRNVLYLHTEDAREFTVAPRLRAAGADMDRVLFVDVHTELTDTGTLILPADVLMLDELVVEHDVSLIVLDAATSAMSSELSGKDDRQVRQFLEPLAQLAARRDCVVLGLCHFGKRDGNDTGKLILGSIAWSQVARSVLSVAKDDDTGNLIVTNTKGNLAPRTRSMEAVIESATIDTDDGTADVGVLRWLGESERDARDLLAGPVDDTDVVERSEAEQVILAYLEDHGGSAPAADVLKHARAVGLSDNAAKKARIKAKVRTERQGFGKGASWVWTIDAPIDSIDSHSRERAPMEPMAESSTPSEVPTAASPTDPCPVCGLKLGAIAAPDGIHPDCRRKRLQSINGGAA